MDAPVLEGKLFIDGELSSRFFRVQFSEHGLHLDTGDLVEAPQPKSVIYQPVNVHEKVPMRFRRRGRGLTLRFPKDTHILKVFSERPTNPVIFRFVDGLGEYGYGAYPGEEHYYRPYVEINAQFAIQRSSIVVEVNATAGPIRPPKIGANQNMDVRVLFELPLELVPSAIGHKYYAPEGYPSVIGVVRPGASCCVRYKPLAFDWPTTSRRGYTPHAFHEIPYCAGTRSRPKERRCRFPCALRRGVRRTVCSWSGVAFQHNNCRITTRYRLARESKNGPSDCSIQG